MANINETIRKKQKLFVGLIIAGIMGVSYAVVSFNENADGYEPIVKKEDDQVVTDRYSGIGSNVDEDEIWRAKSSNQIDVLQEENERLKRQLNNIESGMEREIKRAVREQAKGLEKKTQDELNKIKGEASKLGTPDFDPEAFKAELEDKFRRELTGQTSQPSNAVKAQPQQQVSVERKFFTRPGQKTPGLSDYNGDDLYKRSPAKEIESLSFDAPTKNFDAEMAELERTVKEEAKKEEYRGLTADKYIPSGSFVRSILLGGLDAPTGGQSQDDPHPVLLEVEDIANLPNSLKYDIKECRIIASGYGDISSERAIVRLEKMSCIDYENRVYESAVQGFVYDETGKVGIKGRVISKQGQMIANSLIAGIGAGIGNAFRDQATQYSTNSLGTMQESFADGEAAAAAGFGEGVGTAMDRLAKYYIDLAEQMFPVIEVDAGRMVDVVFTSGVDLSLKQPVMGQSGTQESGGIPQNQSAMNKPVSQMTLGDMARAGQSTVDQSMNMMQQQMR